VGTLLLKKRERWRTRRLSLSLDGKLRTLRKKRLANHNHVQRNYGKRQNSIENGPQP
jgi:hypothetical protein